MSINLGDFLICENTFIRMRYDGNFPPDAKYSNFKIWNLECIAALSNEEYNWTVELCRRMNENKISLMDEESNAVFLAHKIYFDTNKNLCITNPR